MDVGNVTMPVGHFSDWLRKWGIVINTDTVSYTHLDVYKRQVPIQSRNTDEFSKLHTETVSYTHLDVYKRQK